MGLRAREFPGGGPESLGVGLRTGEFPGGGGESWGVPWGWG